MWEKNCDLHSIALGQDFPVTPKFHHLAKTLYFYLPLLRFFIFVFFLFVAPSKMCGWRFLSLYTKFRIHMWDATRPGFNAANRWKKKTVQNSIHFFVCVCVCIFSFHAASMPSLMVSFSSSSSTLVCLDRFFCSIFTILSSVCSVNVLQTSARRACVSHIAIFLL